MHPDDDFTIDSWLSGCLELLARMEELLRGFQPMSAAEARHASTLPRTGGGDVVTEVAHQCTSIQIARADPDTLLRRLAAREPALRGKVESLADHFRARRPSPEAT